MAQEINKNEFKEILAKEDAVLADFYSETCVPCRQMAPVLEELEGELGGRIRAVKINVANEGGLSAEYGVSAVPTFVLFKKGKETARIVGAVPKARLAEMTDKL